MNFLALLGALVTILSAGFGTLLFVRQRQWQSNFASSVALSWILGTGVVSLLVWTFGFFAKGALLPTLVAIVCVALPLVVWRMSGHSSILFRPWKRPGRIELALGALLAVEIAIVFYLSYVHTLGGDGVLNWEIKARYAYANAGVLPLSYLQDSGRAFSHPEYPLAIPYTELWLYFWMGDTNQFWAKTIFPLFYVAGVILLATVGTELTGKVSAGLTASALLFFVPQIAVEQGSVIVGYADFPLSVFYLATIGCLLCACRSDDHGSFRIYAACLALLPWVKREGMILWLVAALCGGFVIVGKRKSPVHFLALLPGLVVIVGWRLYLSQMHAVASSDFLPANLAVLRANIHRLGPIVSEFFCEFTNLQRWSLLWGLTAVASGFFLCRYRDLRALVLLAGLIAPIGIYAFIYIFSAWSDYVAHIELSMCRLLMHTAPLALLILAAVMFSNFSRPAESIVPPRSPDC